MTTVRFNPLTYANKLKAAGVNAQQAEVFAQLQEEIIIDADKELVTKSFLATELKTLEITMIKWMIGISFAQLGLIITLMSFLIKHGS
jgi:hypothetical protein